MWKYPRRFWPIIRHNVQQIVQYLVPVVIHTQVSLPLTNFTFRNAYWKAECLVHAFGFPLKLSYCCGIKKNSFLHTTDPLQLSAFCNARLSVRSILILLLPPAVQMDVSSLLAFPGAPPPPPPRPHTHAPTGRCGVGGLWATVWGT
jgi:hypothetical protein